MMVRPWPLLAALTLLPACNCGQDEPDPTTTGPTATPEPKVPRDKAVLEAVEALGADGAVVVVVRPGQWAAVHQALSSWLARLPAQAEPLRQAKTAEDLPRLFAFPLGLGQVDIQGWDPSRPAVASLAETPYDGIPGSVITQLPTLDRKIPPLRHQVLLPATDPSTLVGSLTGLLGPMGKPWPALVEGHAGAHAIDMGDASVALFPADSAVRVVIFQGGVLPDEAERLAYHKEHLTATPQAPVHTPALSLLAQPDGMISALVRPWRLRPLAVLTGSTEMLYALATVGSGNIDSIMARGMHYVLMSELTMTDEGAEVDDLAMSLTADEGTLRVHSVMSLTPKGETIFEAAAKGAGSVQAAANTDAWVDLTMRADARAMLNAAPMPPVFTRGKKLRDGLEAIQNGGFLALGYVSLRYPLGMLRVAEGFAKKERLPLPLTTLPVAAHVLWHGFPPQEPKIAMALHWPKDFDASPLSALVPVVQSSQREFRSLSMDTTDHDGQPMTVFGLGGVSRSAFDSKTRLPGDAFMEGRISLSKLGAELVRHEPEVGALMVGTGDLVFSTERNGRALVTEVAWSAAPGEVQTKAVPVSTDASWDSPIGPGSDREGARCLADAGWTMSEGLGAIGLLSEDTYGVAAAKILAEMETALTCAAKDDATKDAATRLRTMTTQLLVNALVANHDSKTALTLLGQQCERSKDPPLCDQKKALEALPHPTPVTLEVSETCAPAYGDRGEADVRFDGKSISIDDEPVALAEVGRTLAKIFADADRAAEEVGLIRAEPPPEEEGGTDTAPRRSVSLSIDAEVGMASARPLLRALSEQDVGTVVLIVRDESGGRKIWPVRLRKKAPSIATKPLPSTPTSPADTGVLALMKTPEELWATIEVYSQKTIIRSWANPEPREQFAPGSFPSTATIRSATTDTSTIYVYGDDAAKWKEVALAAAASCEHTLLVLDDPHP